SIRGPTIPVLPWRSAAWQGSDNTKQQRQKNRPKLETALIFRRSEICARLFSLLSGLFLLSDSFLSGCLVGGFRLSRLLSSLHRSYCLLYHFLVSCFLFRCFVLCHSV